MRLVPRVDLYRAVKMRHALAQRKRNKDIRWKYIQFILVTIGNMTISWAGIELMLAHLIVWHHENGGRAIEPELPRMLSKQLDYIRKHIEKDPRLKGAISADLREMRIEVARLNETRKSLIHGTLHLTHTIHLTWSAMSLRMDQMGWRYVKTDYSNEELQRASSEMAALGSRLSPFIAEIIGLPHTANSAGTSSGRSRL